MFAHAGGKPGMMGDFNPYNAGFRMVKEAGGGASWCVHASFRKNPDLAPHLQYMFSYYSLESAASSFECICETDDKQI